MVVLREKSYQLEVEVAGMTTELQRHKADLARASEMIDGGCWRQGHAWASTTRSNPIVAPAGCLPYGETYGHICSFAFIVHYALTDQSATCSCVVRLFHVDADAARNQLSDQLADARRQHARAVEEASGQEEMYKARMQQLEVRAEQ